MTEFAAAKVKIILAANAPTAVAAKRVTSTIPIVLLAVNDPVGLGLVKSLERIKSLSKSATCRTAMTRETCRPPFTERREHNNRGSNVWVAASRNQLWFSFAARHELIGRVIEA